jgi:hypothetical protein
LGGLAAKAKVFLAGRERRGEGFIWRAGVGERVGFFPNRIGEEFGRITSGARRVHPVLLDGMTSGPRPSVAGGGRRGNDSGRGG